MAKDLFHTADCFTQKAGSKNVAVHVLNDAAYAAFLNDTSDANKRQLKQQGFEGRAGQNALIRDADGFVSNALIGCGDTIGVYTICPLVEALKKMGHDFIHDVTFEIKSEHSDDAFYKLCTGWGLSHYIFDKYKKSTHAKPILVWPKAANKDLITADIEAICFTRNLVNAPREHLGTDQLAEAAQNIAGVHGGTFIKFVDEQLLDKNFPLIHAVGRASHSRPQLADFKWGNKDHPKVTLVGKGIVFDTGGVNIKPRQFMRDMKKDMGGAAQVLGLADMIMAHKLPINLRVLIPTAENSISDNAFRPGDILKSRKGLTVEIGDTDAEGRLVVADALAYACEDDPDLVIDFCTLTGAARVALGYDIPAFLTNNDDLAPALTKSGMENDDPVWQLPLWAGYEKDINTPLADVLNDGKGRAGAIEAGLFLQRFITPKTDWIHLDCYAWEQSGKPGRPQGGADTGLRAVFHMLKDRYASAA